MTGVVDSLEQHRGEEEPADHELVARVVEQLKQKGERTERKGSHGLPGEVTYVFPRGRGGKVSLAIPPTFSKADRLTIGSRGVVLMKQGEPPSKLSKAVRMQLIRALKSLTAV